MVYDNCTAYIKNELEIHLAVNQLNDKKIVFLSLDSLTKVLIYLLQKDFSNDISIIDISIIDPDSDSKKWESIEVMDNISMASDFLRSNANKVIIITEKRARELFEDIGYVQKPDDIVVDLSYIRMTYLPNSLENYIDGDVVTLRSCQLTILPLLKYFKEFCEKNGLRYYLEGGTLLGAVRHKGFIPWDDDLDIAMPMPDFLELCRLFPRDSAVFFESAYNECLEHYPLSTLTKLKSKELMTEFSIFPVRMLSGMGLDIFPLCGYPDSLADQQKYLQEFWHLADQWKKDVVIPYGVDGGYKEKYLDLVRNMESVALRYDYDQSEYIGYAYFGYDNYPALDNTRAMPRLWYINTTSLQFEDDTYCAPACYDQVLRKWYGDYMIMPPAQDQKPHDSQNIYRVSSRALSQKMFR